MHADKDRHPASHESPTAEVAAVAAGQARLEHILRLAGRISVSPRAAIVVFCEGSANVAARMADDPDWPSAADVAALARDGRDIGVDISAAGRRITAPLAAADGRTIGVILLQDRDGKGPLASDQRAMLADLAAIAADEVDR